MRETGALKASDLLVSAGQQLPSGRGRPLQTHLRRTVSTVYYALFPCLARSCADTLVGKTLRGSRAWNLAYRSLSHGRAREACMYGPPRLCKGSFPGFRRVRCSCLHVSGLLMGVSVLEFPGPDGIRARRPLYTQTASRWALRGFRLIRAPVRPVSPSLVRVLANCLVGQSPLG